MQKGRAMKTHDSGRTGRWLVLFLGLAASAACGGGTTDSSASGGGPGTDTGGSASGGGAASTGGTSSATGGASPGSGGAAPSGGGTGDGAQAGMGGSPASGGAASGGAASGGAGSGGLPGICDCEAAEIPVCGVDGETYSVGCGTVCVPVDIACTGECPCDPDAGCGCTTSGSAGCSAGLMWECGGQDFDPAAPSDLGCLDLGMSAIRYCCPVVVTPDDFCPP